MKATDAKIGKEVSGAVSMGWGVGLRRLSGFRQPHLFAERILLAADKNLSNVQYIESLALRYDIGQLISIRQMILWAMRLDPIMQSFMPSDVSGNRFFALCESCFWSATVLRMKDKISCPLCKEIKGLSLIPLQTDESYRLSMSGSSGLEVSFTESS